tara:strand:+ start:438 stop:1193 length:756 start_codon:yes stop_codon:yes gene_type:complete
MNNMTDNNTTLVVATCDSYSFLWENFKILAERYLPFKNSKKIAFTETKTFGDGYITSNHTEPTWSNRFIKALDDVKTEYVFFILEDYYFTTKITQQDCNEITRLMRERNLDKFMFYGKDFTWLTLTGLHPKAHVFPQGNPLSMPGKFYLQHPTSMYLTSTGPAFWKTEYLKRCLVEGWSPWEFEIKGSERMAGQSQNIMLYSTDTLYFNAWQGTQGPNVGKEGRSVDGRTMPPGWEELKQKENLPQIVTPN